MERLAEVKLVVRDVGCTNLEIDLLCCLGSGFKMIKLCKATLVASAECALRHGGGLAVEPCILQQCVRLQSVRNTQLCQPLCVYRERWFAKS